MKPLKPGRFSFASCALLAMSFIVLPQPASSQVLYGSMVGSIQDPSGSPVPGASVNIRQTETGVTRTATSADSGAFSFPTLPGGTYRVTVNMAGFQVYTASGVFRSFRLREGLTAQLRFEAFNLTNTPHFANPGASTSNLLLNPDGTIKSLGSYTVISATTGTGREGIDQRALRLGLRIAF